MGIIDFNKVIAYSKLRCAEESLGECATYVKTAFKAGGCKYISGNGWSNQSWCQQNGFQCIGDFVPEGKNPRKPASKNTTNICNVNGLQFPKMTDGSSYKQQMGDVCLIKHGEYGHICYAMSDNINDWVSDYFQKPPVQLDGTGPYCYKGNIERVQIWRHPSATNDTPKTESTVQEETVQTKLNVNNSEIEKSNKLHKSKTVFNGHSDYSKKTESGMVLGTHLIQI